MAATSDIKSLFTLAMKGDLPVIESILATNVFNINQLYPDSTDTLASNNAQNPFSGLTILMVACKYGHIALAKSLVLNHRANVNAQSSNQTCENTALGIAAAIGNNDLVTFLQSKGASINIKNANDDTPLHIACACGKNETADLLLKMGAIFDAPNKSGETPLMIAAKSGLVTVIQTLVGKHANVKAVGRHGDSVLHFAAQSGNPKVVQVLIGGGADATARNKAGKMAIDYCPKDKKECRDVFEKEFARLQEKADEYSKSFMQAPKKKQQQKKQQQKGKKIQPYQKLQQQQQQKKVVTPIESDHAKEVVEEKEEKEIEESISDDNWTVVGPRKKRTIKKSQQIKPKRVIEEKAAADDDDDDEGEENDENEEKEDKPAKKDGIDEKSDCEELTKEQLQEKVRRLEEEVKSFNSRHTKARKLRTKMNIWEKSLASTPQGEALDITVSHVMESIFGSKNLSLLSPSQLCALEELHTNAIKNISQAKIIQAQKQQKAIIQEQHNK